MPANPYRPDRPLYSLHVPKAAGSSLRKTLQDWFGEGLKLHYRGLQGEPPDRFQPQPGDCVHGHFNRVRGIGVRDYYPDAEDFIVFLREPFDRFVSQWKYLHYQKRAGGHVPELDDGPSFETWMRRRHAFAVEQEDPFGTSAQLPFAAPPAQAFDRGFVFVGLLERFASDIGRLADVLSRPKADAQWVNTAGEPQRAGDPAEDYAPHRAAYAALFPWEYELYAAAEAWRPA